MVIAPATCAEALGYPQCLWEMLHYAYLYVEIYSKQANEVILRPAISCALNLLLSWNATYIVVQTHTLRLLVRPVHIVYHLSCENVQQQIVLHPYDRIRAHIVVRTSD
jgi:hypothetical protein